MNPRPELLTAIAREHIGIENLETRNSDSLDSHDVSVRGVKDALHAAYQAGANDRTGDPAPDFTLLQEALEVLERAEFLMRRVEKGDHQALENLPSAAAQARAVLAKPREVSAAPCVAEASSPVMAIEVRGGLIEDIDATIRIDVVVEDWDVEDFDTGKRPARNVWALTGGLSAKRAAKLRGLIGND
jgi:hypothetical protein